MDAADLYGLPLDRFVSERAALAKALRGEGDRDEAARVAKLAKPSVAAWAVNQLIRTQRREVTELFEAGDALRAAQEDVVAGRGAARALREAGDRERAAVSALLERARGLLSSEGQSLSPVTLERVSDTLHAAALEPEARTGVEHGCLTHELRHVGLGEFALAGGGAAPARGKPARGKPARASKTAREHDARAEAERAKRNKRIEAARTAEATSRRRAERARRELETARERRERAVKALREAEDDLAAAEARAGEAAQALDAARTELDDLEA